MAESIPGGGPDRRTGSPRTASSDYAFKQFGGSTRRVDRMVSVGTTITTILRTNPDRIFWAIYNRATVQGSVGWTQQLTAAQGIPLPGETGYVSQSVLEDGDVVSDAVYGISSAAGAQWFVFEIVRYRVREGQLP